MGCCFIAIGIPCDGFLRGFENSGLIMILFAGSINFIQGNRWPKFTRESIFLISLFLLSIFGYFYANSIHELNKKVGLKVLFLLFPIAFTYNLTINDAIKRLTILLFTTITAILAFLSCLRYFLHYQEYNILIEQSKPIEIIGGTMHIYFSVIMAIAVFLGLHLIIRGMKISLENAWDRLIFIGVIINILALHILSARTGLFAFYSALLVVLIRYSIINKRFKMLFGGLFVIFLFPTIMYIAVPSVKNRLNNTYEDLNRYFTGDYVGYFSISGRFETWKAAYHIFEDHPIFGVGAGDLQEAIEAQYKIDNTRLMREETLPNCHNQYLETLAAHGLIGFFFFITLFVLLIQRIKYLPVNNYILLAFVTIFVSALMVESLFERQAGITLFLFVFYLIKNNANSKCKIAVN